MFSDITEGERSKAFSNVNAIAGLQSSKQYRNMMLMAGFCDIEDVDMSTHLRTNFSKMLKQLLKHCDLEKERVAKFAESLRFRLQNPDVISWNFFWAKKRDSPKRIFCSAKIERSWFSNMPWCAITHAKEDRPLSKEEFQAAVARYRDSLDGISVTIADRPEGIPAKALATMSTGTDHLSGLDEAVKWCTTPKAIAPCVAEYLLATTICATRRIGLVPDGQDKCTKPWSFRQNCHGKALSETKIGVIGMGTIAREFAKKLQGMCNDIRFTTRSSKPPSTPVPGATHCADLSKYDLHSKP